MKLPQSYRTAMQELLGEQAQAYFESFDQPAYQSIRINTNKISVADFLKISPFTLKPIPWTSNGFYTLPEDHPGKHPYYYAGLYYIQEPSAMLPAQVLPIEPGDFVLDTCAAPGGKSSELANKLNGTGLLFSNDISTSRCQALLKNLERQGVANAYVCSEDLVNLAQKLPCFFDKILIDAPCSGEGMFRKDHSLIQSWEEKGNAYYAPIQKGILEAATKLLKPGGMLVYSTCTFSPLEDEQVLQTVLEKDVSLELVSIPHNEGFEDGIGLKECVRLYPHRIKGEGHFVALVKKAGTSTPNPMKKKSNLPNNKEAQEFLSHIHKTWAYGSFVEHKEKLIFEPNIDTKIPSIRLLRSGLYIGDCKKNRFEPSQALASHLKLDEFDQSISLSRHDERIIKYLKGETIDVSDFNTKWKGYVLIGVDGYSLGFGKISNGIVKNKYKKGWRWQ